MAVANQDRPYVSGTTLGSFVRFCAFVDVVLAFFAALLDRFMPDVSHNTPILVLLASAIWVYVIVEIDSTILFGFTAGISFVEVFIHIFEIINFIYKIPTVDKQGSDPTVFYALMVLIVVVSCFYLLLMILCTAAFFKLTFYNVTKCPQQPQQKHRQNQNPNPHPNLKTSTPATVVSVEKSVRYTSDSESSSSSSSRSRSTAPSTRRKTKKARK